jgi:hypothetical protein
LSSFNTTFSFLPKKLGGLGYDTPVVYQPKTEYWGNSPEADDLWAAIDTDVSNIALSEKFVESHSMRKDTVHFPWDDSKRLYITKVYHQLHCLVRLLEKF